MDRLFWVLLRRVWSRWSDVLVVVTPETVVRWHRDGFRRYWARLSRRSQHPGRPLINTQIRSLVHRMAFENPSWGAPRIHGELQMLGFDLSERTVSRYMPRRPARPDAIQRWRTFLRNHREAIAAMDFFVVPTATFRVLYVWFVIGHGRRRILHFNVTDAPSAPWVAQQIREAFPFEHPIRHMIFDRDATFSAHVVAHLKSCGIGHARTSFRSPWQNGTAERWVGSVRREILDHVVVFNERHLLRLLREYVAYYHEDRTHLGLGKTTPAERTIERPSPDETMGVVAMPRLGGLHHRYTWRRAA